METAKQNTEEETFIFTLEELTDLILDLADDFYREDMSDNKRMTIVHDYLKNYTNKITDK